MVKCYIVFILLLAATIGSARAQSISIDTCYAMAVKNFPLIKQYDLIEKTKEYNLSNASKAYLPQVSLTAIEGYVLGDLPSFGASSSSSKFKFIGLAQVNQTIWDGGATKTQKKIINASAETDKASVDVSINDLKSRVNQLYFGILLIDEQLKQLEVQDTVLHNNINRIEQLHNNGLAYSTDVDEIEVELLKLNQQKRSFNYTRHGYVQVLTLLIGAKLDDQTAFQTPIVSTQILDPSINRPELSLYKSQRDLVNAQAGMQKVNLMPKIGVLGAGTLIEPGISLGTSKLSNIGVIGLSASWNISGLYTNNNDKKLTQEQLKKIDVQEDVFLFNTRLDMAQTSANIEKQKANLSDDNEIVSLRQKIREGYQVKYDNGASTLIDFLNATENERDARSQKAVDEMELLMTLYDYKTITGN